jgi:hypothetical protein
VFELTFNYGIRSYTPSNDFAYVLLDGGRQIMDRVLVSKYPHSIHDNSVVVVESPDGYPFHIQLTQNPPAVLALAIYTSSLAHAKGTPIWLLCLW